jgi:DNA-directed RNA polymerase sigma subunit (sigma70/sigma32)
MIRQNDARVSNRTEDNIKKIKEMMIEGKSLRKMSAILNISYERVRQIINRYITD